MNLTLSKGAYNLPFMPVFGLYLQIKIATLHIKTESGSDLRELKLFYSNLNSRHNLCIFIYTLLIEY